MAGRRNILVVEDEPLIGFDFEVALVQLGARVLGPVSSVAAASELMAKEQVDCAVLDVNLRGETVFPVADALAAAGIPFVLVTGLPAHALPREHRERPLVQKPYRFSELLDAISEVCGTGRRDRTRRPARQRPRGPVSIPPTETRSAPRSRLGRSSLLRVR